MRSSDNWGVGGEREWKILEMQRLCRHDVMSLWYCPLPEQNADQKLGSACDNRHRTHASTVNEASLPQEGYVDRTLSTRTILRWFRYFRMLCRDDFKKNKSKIGGEGSILEGDESLFGQRSCKIVHNIDHSFSLLFIF